MKKVALLLFVALTAMAAGAYIAQSPDGPLPLYAVKAKIVEVPGSTVTTVPCNPPEPEGSPIVCSQPNMVLNAKCPDGTIAAFPHYNNPLREVKKDDVFWCVLVGPANGAAIFTGNPPVTVTH